MLTQTHFLTRACTQKEVPCFGCVRTMQSYILSLCTVRIQNGAECGHWSKPCAVLWSLTKGNTSVYPARWWLCCIVVSYSLLCSWRVLCGRIPFSFGTSKGSYQTLPAFCRIILVDGRWPLKLRKKSTLFTTIFRSFAS